MTPGHNPFAGETPFPAAGEGVVLKFTTSDIARIHSLHGPDTRKPPEVDGDGRPVNVFWSTILGYVSVHDPVVIGNLLRVGLKEPGDDGKLRPIKRDEDWWDDPPFSYSDVAETLEFGITLSRWGMTPAELAAHLQTEAERLRDQLADGGGEENPTQETMTGSPTSSD